MDKFKNFWIKRAATDTEDMEYKAQLEEYMRKLGIEGAGPVPNSLLARQDLEPNKAEKCNCGKCADCMTQTFKAAFEGTDMPELVVAEVFEGHNILIGPELIDSDGHRIGCWVVMGHDGEWQTFFTIEDAREFVGSVFKASVEQTGKELDEAAEEAKHVDIATDSIVENIKNIQIKRQKATIAAREKEQGDTKKSFRDGWKPFSRH